MELDYSHFIPHIILVIFLICITEYAFQSFWNSKYYKSGIVCFRIRRNLKLDISKLPLNAFEEQFAGYSWFYGLPIIPAIVFKDMDSKYYAFREKNWVPSLYLPVMRGLIYIEPNEGKIIFLGKLNYSPILLLLIILPFIFEISFPSESSWAFFVLFFLISALIQYIRYTYISIRTLYIINNL